jgi:hypothetical protein
VPWIERNWTYIGPPKRGLVLPDALNGWRGDDFVLGGLRVRTSARIAWLFGKRVELAPVPWKGLVTLCEAWPERAELDRADVAILRRKLCDELIVNDYGCGYLLVELRAPRRRESFYN